MIFGIGLHVLVAIYFAVHCVRTGRQLFWLFILFSFPLLGSLVYFIVEYLPDLRVGAKVNRAGTVAAKVLDPNRELREAEIALQLTPTAQNRLRLANALQAAGRNDEAAAQFELCLQGPFANDPDIGLAAARAHLQNGDAKRALSLLTEIRSRNSAFRSEAMAIEIARALEAQGDRAAAGQELRLAELRFGSVEVRAEYAIWAAAAGDVETARRMQEELEKSWANWNSHARALHRPLLKRVEAAIGATGPFTS